MFDINVGVYPETKNFFSYGSNVVIKINIPKCETKIISKMNIIFHKIIRLFLSNVNA